MRRRPTRFPSPPTSRDDFRVALFDNENREPTIYRSKAVGEPPLMLAISVFAAIADAIHSINPGKPMLLDAPATPESILKAVGNFDAAAALANGHGFPGQGIPGSGPI